MLNVQRDLLYEMIIISIFTSSGILYFDVRSGSVKYKGEMIEMLFSKGCSGRDGLPIFLFIYDPWASCYFCILVFEFEFCITLLNVCFRVTRGN